MMNKLRLRYPDAYPFGQSGEKGCINIYYFKQFSKETIIMKKATIISLVIALVLAFIPVYATETDIGSAIMKTADGMIVTSDGSVSNIGSAFCMDYHTSDMIEFAMDLGPAIMKTADGIVITTDSTFCMDHNMSNTVEPAVNLGPAIMKTADGIVITSDRSASDIDSAFYVDEKDHYVCCSPLMGEDGDPI